MSNTALPGSSTRYVEITYERPSGSTRQLSTVISVGCSNFIHHLLETDPDLKVVNFDSLTYAGNLANLAAVADDPRYEFIVADYFFRALADLDHHWRW